MYMPKIMICSDSAMLDTGFGRVAREIGTGLMKTGKYRVVQHGWFHSPHDRLVPFPIVPTYPREQVGGRLDDYGHVSYDDVVAQEKPDVVIGIGDPWVLDYMTRRPRRHVLIGYTPIDSGPIPPHWAETFAGMDSLVLFGKYAFREVKQIAPQLNPVVIPHGVDTDTFKPIEDQDLIRRTRDILTAGNPDRFLIGCVARNSQRKQLPRLLKAVSEAIHPWIACPQCGGVTSVFAKSAESIVKEEAYCPVCRNKEGLRIGDGNKNLMLYLHCAAEDEAGHKLFPLISRYKLNGHIVMPDNMMIGRGIPDWQLNEYYNAMDLFSLPTSGEGWGLPISEAMAAGTPVLVTNYSAHVDYVAGAGELIDVREFDTFTVNNCERALTDITDHHRKIDRFAMEFDQFWNKWQFSIEGGDVTEQSMRASIPFGKTLRKQMSKVAHERMQKYKWSAAVEMWVKLVDATVLAKKNNPDYFDAPTELPIEVFQ